MKKAFNILYNIVAVLVVCCFVFTVSLKLTSTQAYAVETPSMEPELAVGDLIFVRKANGFSEGDIISAKLSNGSVFTHRVYMVDNEQKLIYTVGDSNPGPDSLPTPFDDVLGKVVFSVPLLGFLSLHFNATTAVLILAGLLLAITVIRFVIFHIKSKGGKQHEEN